MYPLPSHLTVSHYYHFHETILHDTQMKHGEILAVVTIGHQVRNQSISPGDGNQVLGNMINTMTRKIRPREGAIQGCEGESGTTGREKMEGVVGRGRVENP